VYNIEELAQAVNIWEYVDQDIMYNGNGRKSSSHVAMARDDHV
jgi:hypothetical protein